MKTTIEERAQQVRAEYAFVEVVTVPGRVVRCFHPRRRDSDYLIMETRTGYACTCTAWSRSEEQVCKHGQALVEMTKPARFPVPVSVPEKQVGMVKNAFGVMVRIDGLANTPSPVSVPAPIPPQSLQDAPGSTFRVTVDDRGRINDSGW
jgi:hypothetical protein